MEKLARDACGVIIHDLPNAVMQINAFPMGHLYLHQYNNSIYTLVNTAAPSINVWVNGKNIVTDGNTNIKGVRLSVFLQGESTSGPGTCQRPGRPAGGDGDGA